MLSNLRRNAANAAIATCVSLLATAAYADLTVLAHYRMGEEDPGAAPNEPVTVAVDDIEFAGENRDLVTDGGPVYVDDTPPGIDSSLSVVFAGESIPGLYREAEQWHSLYPGFRVGMEAWLKVFTSGEGTQMTVMREGSGYGLSIDPQGSFSVNGTGPAPTPVDFEEWQHVAWWTTGSFWQIYVNGEPQFDPLPEFNYGSPGGQFTVGFHPNGGEEFFGLMDELRIFTWTGPFDTADLLWFTQRKAGDVNEDGIVNSNDYDIWRMHVGEDVSGFSLLEGRALGDLDGNRIVDLDDFAQIKANIPAGASIPEPSSTALLLLGMAALAGRARRQTLHN